MLQQTATTTKSVAYAYVYNSERFRITIGRAIAQAPTPFRLLPLPFLSQHPHLSQTSTEFTTTPFVHVNCTQSATVSALSTLTCALTRYSAASTPLITPPAVMTRNPPNLMPWRLSTLSRRMLDWVKEMEPLRAEERRREEDWFFWARYSALVRTKAEWGVSGFGIPYVIRIGRRYGWVWKERWLRRRNLLRA